MTRRWIQQTRYTFQRNEASITIDLIYEQQVHFWKVVVTAAVRKDSWTITKLFSEMYQLLGPVSNLCTIVSNLLFILINFMTIRWYAGKPTRRRVKFLFKMKIVALARGGVLEDVLGLKDVLEDTFWSPWPWPRSLKSSKIALSSAQGQHYFLNSWNFVGKRQKPRGKFANTFFIFLTWSIGVGKGPPPIEISPMTKMWQKSLLFLQFQFLFSIFRLQQYN